MTNLAVLLFVSGGVFIGVGGTLLYQTVRDWNRGFGMTEDEALDAIRRGFDHFGWPELHMETDEDLERGVHEIGLLMYDHGYRLRDLAEVVKRPWKSDPDDDWGPGA